MAGRLAALSTLLQGDGAGAKPFSPGAAADAIALETGDVAATVWTHNPADSRERRRRWGHELAGLVRAPVLHAVGDAVRFQWTTDLHRPLDPPLVEAKLDFVNTYCADLLRLGAEDDDALLTRRIPAVERFFGSIPEERRRLFAIADGDTDPWELATSQYELERLDATTVWVRAQLDPAAGHVIEVGACEGALTRRLLEAGYTVDATEPNPLFLERLQLLGPGAGELRIHPHSFEELGTTRRLTGSAYLLIELLYGGQDLGLLSRFPTDRLFVALEPAALDRLVWPIAWSVEEEVELVLPRVEPVAGGRAYVRKPGSRGLLLRRR